MSVRGNILNYVETNLGTITGVGDISVGKFRNVDIDTLTLPCIFVDFGNDRVASGPMGYESFVVPIDIEAWTPDTDREDFLEAVHTKMMEDETQNGYALSTTRGVCKQLFVDPMRHLTGFVVQFEILYRHPRGTP